MTQADKDRRRLDARATRILIIDDHPIVVAGIRRLLRDAGFGHMNHTSSLARAFRQCRRLWPDIVIVDLAIAAGDLFGLSFVRRLRRYDPNLPVLVLTMHDNPAIARAALKMGANGYISKSAPSEEVVQGLLTVVGGKPYVSKVLASELAFLNARQSAPNVIESLSSRERYVLSMLAEGKSYAQIADNLAISYKSVAYICGRLKPKLGLQSRQELVSFAMQNVPSAPSVVRLGTKSSRKPR